MRSVVVGFCVFVACQNLLAAISSATVFEMRPTNGNDSNGGGFVTGATGTDFSQQNSAQYTFSDLTSANANTNPCVVSSVSHSFVGTDVGNILNISAAGVNFTTGRYQIVSVAGGNATFDRACGSAAAASGGTYFVGGALKTFSVTIGAMVAGNIAWVKAESTITTAATIPINEANGISATSPAVNGYTTTRGDGGSVTVQATATVQPILNITSAGVTVANFIVDCNSQASTQGVTLGATGVRAFNLQVKNCPGNFGVVFNGQSSSCIICSVTNQTGGTAAFNFNSGSFSTCFGCSATGGTVLGFNVGSGGNTISYSIAANNTGGSTDGFLVTGSQANMTLDHVLAYKNGRDGIRFTTPQQAPFNFTNSIVYGNTGVGLNNTTGQLPTGTQWFDYNCVGGNTGGNRTNVATGAHDQALSADPTVNGASNNFALNSTAGGGAACKAHAFPGVLLVGGTGFADIGPLQSQAPAGSVAASALIH